MQQGLSVIVLLIVLLMLAIVGDVPAVPAQDGSRYSGILREDGADCMFAIGEDVSLYVNPKSNLCGLLNQATEKVAVLSW